MTTNRVEELEEAILERAQTLAEEHVQQGERSRERILEDSREKIRLLEEKEILSGQSKAEREYRRLVQARELGLQSELDHMRWDLVQSVMESVQSQLAEMVRDEQAYRPLFERLLIDGAEAIERDRLLARISSADRARYADDWESMVAGLLPGKHITLDGESVEVSGGVWLSDEQGRISVDNTFEGIVQRMDRELLRVVVERLFPSASKMGIVFNG